MTDIKLTKEQEPKGLKRKEDMEQFAKYLGIDYDDFLDFTNEKDIDFDDCSS
jgi:hypothetical protein